MIEVIPIKNLRETQEFSNLTNVIRRIADGKKVIFIPAAGNWGDGLINFGSRQFFESISLEYKEIKRSEALIALAQEPALHESIVIVGGGGAWCKNFSSTHQLVSKIHSLAAHVVVLPTTYELGRVEASNVTYFRRDNFLSKNTISESHFCHDMAFFANVNIADVQPRIWRLFAMREDREGGGYAPLFERNIDVSKFGDGTYLHVDAFFQMIALFNVVTTDRMHIAIAASIMGLKVNLIGGNYPKSYDVYRSSIEMNYPNSSFKNIDDIKKWCGISD